MCMIFHKKIFQCVTAPIPLFLTPQKIGLLKEIATCSTFWIWKLTPFWFGQEDKYAIEETIHR